MDSRLKHFATYSRFSFRQTNDGDDEKIHSEPTECNFFPALFFFSSCNFHYQGKIQDTANSAQWDNEKKKKKRIFFYVKGKEMN